MPYVKDDDKAAHNETSFKILDIDRDGFMNVINLMTIFGKKGIQTNTKLG